MQKLVNLVDLVKSFPTSTWSLGSASIYSIHPPATFSSCRLIAVFHPSENGPFKVRERKNGNVVYSMHSFPPFFNLQISAKNRQHFFAIELIEFPIFFNFLVEFCIFLRIFDEFISGFRAKLQKRVRSVAFQSILRKRIRKLPKFKSNF